MLGQAFSHEIPLYASKAQAEIIYQGAHLPTPRFSLPPSCPSLNLSEILLELFSLKLCAQWSSQTCF